MLICYGDHIRSRDPQKTPLQALGEFCRAHFQEEEFAQLTIHLLPIYTSPYKDGGFDITDPFVVNPSMGTWDDVQSLSQHFNVAVDFVANHLSTSSEWFERYMADDPLFQDFFIGFDDKDTVERMEKEVFFREVHGVDGEIGEVLALVFRCDFSHAASIRLYS